MGIVTYYAAAKGRVGQAYQCSRLTIPPDSHHNRPMLKLLRKTLKVLFTVLILLVVAAAAYLFWYTHRPLPAAIDNQPLFHGITYSRQLRTTPRPLVIHIM